MNALNRGYYVAIGLCLVAMFFTTFNMLHSYWLSGAGVVGILISIVVVFITQYYTEARFRPVRSIVESSKQASQ